MDVAIVGGTGKEGFGLALRLLGAGHRVTIGSRSAERAAESVARAKELLGDAVDVEGAENAAAVLGAHIVAVTVPFTGMIEIYTSIAPALQQGQVVLDATSPLMTAVGGTAWEPIRPWHGSAAELAASLVPDGVSVVAGFHTIGAHTLAALDREVALRRAAVRRRRGCEGARRRADRVGARHAMGRRRPARERAAHRTAHPARHHDQPALQAEGRRVPHHRPRLVGHPGS